MGGVYGVQVGAYLTREPVQRRNLTISFGCDPANVDKLQAAAMAEVRAIAKAGIGADYVTKVIEQLRREHEVNLKNNRWWVSSLRSAYYFHEDIAQRLDLDAIVRRVTSGNIKAAASRLFDERNLVVGILRPAAAGSLPASPQAPVPPSDAARPVPPTPPPSPAP
jgi:zinc protease